MVPFVHLLTTGFGHKADVMKASPNVRFWADCVAKLGWF
jgi:hypothetical protein